MTFEDRLRRAGPMVRTRDAAALGVHSRDLYLMRDDGIIVELSRGVFHFADTEPVAGLDLVAIATRAPHATVCLLSALDHWELTDEIPSVIDIAVPRGSTRPAITFPPVRVHTFDSATFELGRDHVDVGDHGRFAISNPERTVVDAFRFRRRIGPDIANAALRRYLARPGARPGEVLDLAGRLRIAGPVQDAMSVLLS